MLRAKNLTNSNLPPLPSIAMFYTLPILINPVCQNQHQSQRLYCSVHLVNIFEVDRKSVIHKRILFHMIEGTKD